MTRIAYIFFSKPLRHILLKSLFVIVIASMLVGASYSLPVDAQGEAVIQVTTPADEFFDGIGSGCSLREAVYSANRQAAFGGCQAGGGITIIYLPDTNMSLRQWGSKENGNLTGDLDIYGNVTLIGAGPEFSVLDVAIPDRAFDIHPGATVKLMAFKITGGVTPSGENGGGIRNRGWLTLDDVWVEGNATSHGIAGEAGGDGGGVYNNGTLNLFNSMVMWNFTGNGGKGTLVHPDGFHGGRGGGIFNDKNGSLMIAGSTVSWNATGYGGGGYTRMGKAGNGGDGAGLYNLADPIIINSTFSMNFTGEGGEASANFAKGYGGNGGGIANEGGTIDLTFVSIVWNGTGGGHQGLLLGGSGGGIYNSASGEVKVKNSVLAGSAVYPKGKGRECFGTITSQDYNLIKYDDDCTIAGNTAHNIYGEDPSLGSLIDNKGPTLTHAPLWRSLLFDRIPLGVNGCGTLRDQRGYERPGPQSVACDIGAVEGVETPDYLPDSGFAPGVLSAVGMQPPQKRYEDMGELWLEIPRIHQRISIIGVPFDNDGWDVSWLGNEAGYLAGTTYPTWKGNTGLTGHVYLADGSPGPFINLTSLRWGDKILVDGYGQRFIYEVRVVKYVRPDDLSVLDETDQSRLTLLTCKDFDPEKKTYRWRLVIQAVLTEIVDQN